MAASGDLGSAPHFRSSLAGEADPNSRGKESEMAGVVCAVDEAGGRPQLRGLTPPDTAALVCDAAEAALTAWSAA
jgi:hypothetical protein